MRFNFHKMHGCGNDFLILDAMKDDDPQPLKKSEVAFLCDRNFGVGADGIVQLSRSHVALAKWNFYNSDGSSASMCGNAARCSVRYLSDFYFPEEEVISIETEIGILKGKKLDSEGNTEVTLVPSGDEHFRSEERVLRMGDEVIRLFIIDTGVPHAVIEVKDIRDYPITEVGKFVQKNSMFRPAETNVTFFQKLVGQQILATTYERGVEKETFACGTGAAAAALVASELYLQPLPIQVEVPGGELIVDISPVAKRLLLRGHAEYVFQFVLEDLLQGFEPKRLYESSGKVKPAESREVAR